MTSLSSITAAGLAGLYAAGLVARAGELSAAGFSPQDILPLVPLQQNLARGVALLVDPRAVFGFLAFAANWVWHLMPPSERQTAGLVKRVDKVATATKVLASAVVIARAAHPEEDFSSTDDRLQHVIALLEELNGPNLSRAEKEVAWVAHELATRFPSDTGQKVADLAPEAPPKERKWIRWILVLLVPVSGGFVVLTITLPLLPTYLVFFAALTVSSIASAREKPLEHTTWRRSIVLALGLFVISQAYLGARPLQMVTLEEVSGNVTSGRLLADPGTQPGTWVLGQAKHGTVAVPGARVKSAEVWRNAGEHGPYSRRNVWDLLHGR